MKKRIWLIVCPLIIVLPVALFWLSGSTASRLLEPVSKVRTVSFIKYDGAETRLFYLKDKEQVADLKEKFSQVRILPVHGDLPGKITGPLYRIYFAPLSSSESPLSFTCMGNYWFFEAGDKWYSVGFDPEELLKTYDFTEDSMVCPIKSVSEFYYSEVFLKKQKGWKYDYLQENTVGEETDTGEGWLEIDEERVRFITPLVNEGDTYITVAMDYQLQTSDGEKWYKVPWGANLDRETEKWIYIDPGKNIEWTVCSPKTEFLKSLLSEGEYRLLYYESVEEGPIPQEGYFEERQYYSIEFSINGKGEINEKE